MNELEEILKVVDGLVSLQGRDWNRFKGDVCARLMGYYIQKYLSPTLKVVGPNVYVDGFPTEFDLLILKEIAEPERFTAAYPPASVVACVEVKEHGVYGGRGDLITYLDRIRRNFDTLCTRFHHIKCIYLTIKEVSQPKRSGSINYLDETKRHLQPHQVFCLLDSRTGTIIKGEWQRFVDFLNKL